MLKVQINNVFALLPYKKKYKLILLIVIFFVVILQTKTALGQTIVSQKWLSQGELENLLDSLNKEGKLPVEGLKDDVCVFTFPQDTLIINTKEDSFLVVKTAFSGLFFVWNSSFYSGSSIFFLFPKEKIGVVSYGNRFEYIRKMEAFTLPKEQIVLKFDTYTSANNTQVAHFIVLSKDKLLENIMFLLRNEYEDTPWINLTANFVKTTKPYVKVHGKIENIPGTYRVPLFKRDRKFIFLDKNPYIKKFLIESNWKFRHLS